MRFNTQMRDDTRLPCKYQIIYKTRVKKEMDLLANHAKQFLTSLISVTLKTEYTIFGNSISITSSLHLNEIERIKNLVIRFPISHCWKDAIKESTFNSITCKLTNKGS